MEINIEQLVKIDVFGVLLLNCIKEGKKKKLEEYATRFKIPTHSIEICIKEGYLTTTSKDRVYTFDNLFITQKYLDEYWPKKEGVEEWILNWYELFPKGIKSGGLPIKTDLADCTKKMIKFCKEYPEYTKGIIITATQKYLNEMKQKNWAYCKIAPYLIYKDGMSILSGLCQGVYENVNNDEIGDENKEQGKTIKGAKDF